MNETSAAVQGQARELRAQAAQLRTEQETLLAAAQAEADRRHAEADQALAEARQKAAGLDVEARNLDRSAEPIEARAVLLQTAEELATTIPAAEARVVELVNEIEALGETTDGIEERLEQRGVEREEIAVQLASAREAGDVDGVLAARQRMSAIDEVTQALAGQRDSANQRIRVIGTPDGDGELAAALGLVLSLRATQRQVLNQLDPERYEAQVDAAIEAAQQYLAWQVELQQEQQPRPVTRIANNITN